MAADVTVATFNLHGGVDAWGRPFDAVRAIANLRADLLLLQEVWTTTGEPSAASQLAELIGGSVHEVTMATGRRAKPHPSAPPRWRRHRARLDGDHALYLESQRPLDHRLASSDRYRDATPGSLGLAIVTTLPVTATAVVHLEHLRRDRVARALLVVTVLLGEVEVTVVCTHMGHLSHGSPLHFSRLRRELATLGGPSRPMVVGGDMNLWGPGVRLQLPGLRRAVKGPTWPSWRPHSQLDHLLVSRPLVVIGGRVVDERASDHRPVLARLRLR